MPAVLDLPAVECAARSDPGRDPTKQVNEDAVGQIETSFGHPVRRLRRDGRARCGP